MHVAILGTATVGRTLAAVEQAGPARLAGKVVIDVTNPLDFSKGFPPTLFVKDTDSLGERVQRAAPEARVVKALNTMTSALMLAPAAVNGGDHSVFICGNDAAAKDEVTKILDRFGWETEDMGGVEGARAIEPLCILWCLPGFLRGEWKHALKLLKQ